MSEQITKHGDEITLTLFHKSYILEPIYIGPKCNV